MTIHHTACILCSRVCGITIEVEDNQFKKIRGDEACPSSKGYICQKAARLTHYQSHPDRLTRPLKKMADGQFVAVSWDQALSEIAAELNLAFFDSYAYFGGAGQMRRLTREGLSWGDYSHLNDKGSQILGAEIYRQLCLGYLASGISRKAQCTATP